ncbi:hypothetical protein ACJMK2_013103 [Sinanodonta woodiana]|uniref:Uncharacterized protein n=1 Tax=Sinanodonta woodiana TaxID=1069815 RepID=A0ABD3VCL8_SINWO
MTESPITEKTSRISVTTRSPQLVVKLPTPVPASKIALTQLRVYYTWPNIRSEPYHDKLPNNSFVFTWKKTPQLPPESHTILLPTGAYDIEDINDEIQERIEAVTGPNRIAIPDEPDKYPIEIHVKEPLLGTTIEINSPNYSVDIYHSTIRSLLGWPEFPPGSIDIANLPLEPQRDNYISSQSNYHDAVLTFDKQFNISNYFNEQKYGTETWLLINQNNITLQSFAMKRDFKQYFDDITAEISKYLPDFNKIITNTEICNNIISYMDEINSNIIQRVLTHNNAKTRTEFATTYKISVDDIAAFKIPKFNTTQIKKDLNDILNKKFKQIHETWLNNLHVVHYQLPEPKFSDFYTDKLPEASTSLKYLHDFSFLHEDDIYNKYSYEVFDGTETDIISKEEYRQHGNLVFRFAFGDRGTYEYSIRDITACFNNQCEQFRTQLQQLRRYLQQSLILDVTTRRSSILQQQQLLNQIIADMNFINDKFLSLIYEDKSPQKDKFNKLFSLNNINMVFYKLPGWCAADLKDSLRNLINEYFPQIYALWVKINPPNIILASNNSP